MKLMNSLKGLITEIASIQDIQHSIKMKNVMTINYNGKEYGRGYRDIEPVCFGVSKSGNFVLRAWEREGSSHSNKVEGNPIPGWRLFRVDKIQSFKPSGDKFNQPKPGYNPRGDKSMTRVIINAVFGNQPAPSPYIDVITSVVNGMLQGIQDRSGVDLSKAAETYKRIYNGIESQTGQRLTNDEKISLRPQISDIINQIQNS
jgi:hypothetical protein